MTNFYDLLEKIREKPGMYLGSPSVSALFHFLQGYKVALMEAGISPNKELQEFGEFQSWLAKRESINISASWAKIIIFQSIDERDGFDNFFKFFDEFLEYMHSERNIDELDDDDFI